jgi:hypothetical protein
MCTNDVDNVLSSVTAVYLGADPTAASIACTPLFSFTVGLQDSS